MVICLQHKRYMQHHKLDVGFLSKARIPSGLETDLTLVSNVNV